jgi:hypothetical protein
MTLVTTQWVFILMFVVLTAIVVIWQVNKRKNPTRPPE